MKLVAYAPGDPPAAARLGTLTDAGISRFANAVDESPRTDNHAAAGVAELLPAGPRR